MVQGFVPTKTASKRDKYSDSCLLIVSYKSYEDTFDNELNDILLVICGNFLKANNSKPNVVSWIEDTRQTAITES